MRQPVVFENMYEVKLNRAELETVIVLGLQQLRPGVVDRMGAQAPVIKFNKTSGSNKISEAKIVFPDSSTEDDED